MKIKGNQMILLSVTVILLLVFSSVAFGQDEQRMKMDEYKVELADAQARETEAATQITALEADIARLKGEIEVVQGQIDAEWAEVYALIGTDKATVDAFRDDLNSIDAEIEGLAALSPEELFRKRDEVEALEKKVAEAKGNKLFILTEMEDKIADLESKLASLNAKMPANIYDQYTVVKGDYLWKISKNEEIYGDPFQWIRI